MITKLPLVSHNIWNIYNSPAGVCYQQISTCAAMPKTNQVIDRLINGPRWCRFGSQLLHESQSLLLRQTPGPGKAPKIDNRFCVIPRTRAKDYNDGISRLLDGNFYGADEFGKQRTNLKLNNEMEKCPLIRYVTSCFTKTTNITSIPQKEKKKKLLKEIII